ncbi:hypothetical protein ACFSGX_07830 [Sphingomonas arantia]|uniref:DUF1376 domain-containing protein n=1 Tax=Sphingomonas arantia TaxID=1460676 RepID=A0ABW4TZ45_9SPHN
MTAAPAPLTPLDCDLRDFPRMMIDIGRLRGSDFDAMPNDGAWRAGLNLWMSAWHVVPAGSLTNDDATLAKAAGLGRDLRTWAEVKEDALRGFVLCGDGRLYHPVVAEIAIESWLEKLFQRLSSGAGNARRWGGTFDSSKVEEDIAAAVQLLRNLAPNSKSLAKVRRRQVRQNADGIPSGSEAIPSGPNDDPTGIDSSSHRDSHRDNNPVPVGSQGTGTGTGNNKKSSEANASGTDAPTDPVKQVFDLGVALLTDAGTKPQPARGLVGKWRKEFGDGAVLAALLDCRSRGISDPAAWVIKRLQAAGPTSGNAALYAHAARYAALEKNPRTGETS